MKKNKIKKVMLMHPNYAILGKRSWDLPPYNLALLNACLKPDYDSGIFDPNFHKMNEAQIRKELKTQQPDVIGLTSYSTEYIDETLWYCDLIKEVLPQSILVLGGVIPTVSIKDVIVNKNIDYFVTGEGEYRFKKLLDRLNRAELILDDLDGLVYRNAGIIITKPVNGFIDELDKLPYPDYSPLNISDYGAIVHKYFAQFIPKQFPFATTITTRGCPMSCTFCAAHTLSGKKVRIRSAENVLKEIDILYQSGIREIVFLDDHFLINKKRVIDIMKGIINRKYDLTWKCGNVAVFALDEELVKMMKKSGCYQMTISPESGNDDVLKNLVKKPVNLQKTKQLVKLAKSLDIEIISNFVIGFPGETWDQIRQTINYAEELDVEMVNFHIATPLPHTELMDVCVKEGFVRPEDKYSGYTKGVISTSEFTNIELQILRAFEWDRINFKTKEKCETFARIEGISMQELEEWRKKTRRNLGVTDKWEG